MSVELPTPIATYFAASNAHDPAACANCFTEDAVVLDERRERRGIADIRAWTQEVIEKYRMTVDIIGAAESSGSSIITGRVSGDFPGSPIDLRYAFTLEGGKIARLEIVS